MNMAEAAAFREVKARVDTLEKQVTELSRRLDAFSAADRARVQERETLTRKHG